MVKLKPTRSDRNPKLLFPTAVVHRWFLSGLRWVHSATLADTVSVLKRAPKAGVLYLPLSR